VRRARTGDVASAVRLCAFALELDAARVRPCSVLVPTAAGLFREPGPFLNESRGRPYHGGCAVRGPTEGHDAPGEGLVARVLREYPYRGESARDLTKLSPAKVPVRDGTFLVVVLLAVVGLRRVGWNRVLGEASQFRRSNGRRWSRIRI